MAARTVHDHSESFRVSSRSRANVRSEVVRRWLAEKAGDRTNRHRYRYDVETLADGSTIYLKRPTRLNKGMDFVIYCQNFKQWKNGNDKPPRHVDLEDELRELCKAVKGSAKRKSLFRSALLEIWNCVPPEEVLAAMPELARDLRSERILKIARWFFIEQDLTYWTESGRWMLRGALEKITGPWE